MNGMQADRQHRQKRLAMAEARRKAMMSLAIQVSLWSSAVGGMMWLFSLAIFLR